MPLFKNKYSLFRLKKRFAISFISRIVIFPTRKKQIHENRNNAVEIIHVGSTKNLIIDNTNEITTPDLYVRGKQKPFRILNTTQVMLEIEATRTPVIFAPAIAIIPNGCINTNVPIIWIVI